MNYCTLSKQDEKYKALEDYIKEKKLVADEELTAQVLGSKITTATKYDTPEVYEVISTLYSDLLSECYESGLELHETPILGTTPSNYVSASIDELNVSNVTVKFILFDSQLYYFNKLLSLVLSNLIEVLGDNIWSVEYSECKILRDVPNDLIDCISKLIKDVLYNERYDNYSKDISILKNNSISQTLNKGMNYFPLAHELGHIHIYGEQDKYDQVIDEPITLEEHTKLDETSADLIGCILTIGVMAQHGASIAVGSSYVYLAVQNLKKKCNYYMIQETIDGFYENHSSTHPPEYERMEYIKTAMLTELNIDESGINSIERFCHNIDCLCDYIFREVVEVI
ncbi:hypothetical protein GLP37_22215 [Photobacterium phosphoreum]|uniref:hypothetical protein n=1 Tax=Photobacterium phosphoreum TaxID=659 RepID=UPI001E2E3C4D|nr:hypothetical protein [Photobacterium phosphoreum]MCD9504876.1 hypothetical protein [Photobacterium phosphoreum]